MAVPRVARDLAGNAFRPTAGPAGAGPMMIMVRATDEHPRPLLVRVRGGGPETWRKGRVLEILVDGSEAAEWRLVPSSAMERWTGWT